jgi:Concanavalin A-like lectin/glucanases superfamily
MWLRLVCVLLVMLALVAQRGEAQVTLNPVHPLARGLVVWLPVLPHLVGTTWYSLARPHHATLVGDVTWVGDPTGQFAGMTGIDAAGDFGFILHAPAVSFEITDPFSLSLTIQQINSGLFAPMLAKQENGEEGIWWFCNDQSEIHLQLIDPTAAIMGWQSPGGTCSTGVRHTFTVTWDGSNSSTGAALYVDGQAVTFTPYSNPSLSGSIVTAGNWIIGNGAAGYYSNIMIHNRALTAQDARQVAALRAPDYAGMLVDESLVVLAEPTAPAAPRLKRRIIIQ